MPADGESHPPQLPCTCIAYFVVLLQVTFSSIDSFKIIYDYDKLWVHGNYSWASSININKYSLLPWTFKLLQQGKLIPNRSGGGA